MAAKRGMDGRTEFGLIGFQVVAGHETAVVGHITRDDLGCPATIELIGATSGDSLERCGEVGLDQPIALLPQGPISFAECGRRTWKVSQSAQIVVHLLRRRRGQLLI